MRTIFILFLAMLPIEHCPQENFLNDFKTIELPFIVDFSSFDIYACDDNMVGLEEKTVNKYLLSETDDFLTRKSQQKLVESGYHDYFTVGKFEKNDYNIALYYRNYRTTKDTYVELMACVFDSGLKLLQTISLSKLDTQQDEFSLCKINDDGDIIIYHLTNEAAESEDMELGIKEECRYSMRKGENNLPFQEFKR